MSLVRLCGPVLTFVFLACTAPAQAVQIGTSAQPYQRWANAVRARVPLPMRPVTINVGPCDGTVVAAIACSRDHAIEFAPVVFQLGGDYRYLFLHELAHVYDYEFPSQRPAFVARTGMVGPWYGNDRAAERFADAYVRCATRSDYAVYSRLPQDQERWVCERLRKLARWRNRIFH